MKRLRQIFKVSLAKIFFAANYVICLVIFDWEKFESYLEMPMQVNCHFPPPSSRIDFCVYGTPPSIFDPIIIFAQAAFLILTLPSTIITEITLEMLNTSFPFWCYETHQIMYIPVFAVINSFYWICLAHIIELLYASYRTHYSPRNKYIGIFKDF